MAETTMAEMTMAEMVCGRTEVWPKRLESKNMMQCQYLYYYNIFIISLRNEISYD
jgi:hypothetical protein